MSRLSWLLLLLVPLLAGALSSADDDPAKDLKSSDPLVRLAAIDALVSEAHPDGGKLLVKALKDSDWEVVARAAEALGELGEPNAVAPLVKLAVEGPVDALRRPAAESLARLDAEAGVKGVAKKLSGDSAPNACEALVRIAPSAESVSPPKALSKLLKGKELLTRAAAARATVCCEREERGAVLRKLLDSPYLAVRAAALEGAALDPRLDQLPVLLEFLNREELDDVLERRALLATAKSAGAGLENSREELAVSSLRTLSGATPAAVAARGPRLAEYCAPEPWFRAEQLLVATEAAREHPDAGVRAAAARAVRFAGGEFAPGVARHICETDRSPRVRRAALASALALESVETAEFLGWLVGRLAAEEDPAVRVPLVVALGEPGLEDAVAGLIAALGDTDRGVAMCAAVSLGRTRSERAVAPLATLVKDSGDWRLRGAAVVGLSQSFAKPGVPAVIGALADQEKLVSRTAHGYLLSIARGEEFPADPKAWGEWWKENERRVQLIDPKTLEERRQKYGYTVPPADIYEGLDVLVLESRGDHIQNILQELGIEHRLTASSRVDADGLDAAGVFVSNCTGELEDGDIERLEWFVNVGGYLFGSCWAVHETIEKVSPGAVRKLETRDEVLDRVVATPWAANSPYLAGVFDGGVRPIYSLLGAHLIEVLEPERVEVLIDSAECAEEWGGGNLACWFPVGHGKILDSVNHFDLQGLEEAPGLKTREDRMAYAMEHMGASFERIRATQKEKFWDSNPRASREIRDLSVFKLITNFVRLRRIEGR